METVEKTWLKVPEVAQELRIPRSRCYELIQAGELPAVRVGTKSIRVHRAQLEEYLLTQRRTGPQTLQTDEEGDDGLTK